MIRNLLKFAAVVQPSMNCKMKLLIFALAVSVLGSGAAAASVPVNATTMHDKGTINVDGYGTVHVVTPWNGNIVVK